MILSLFIIVVGKSCSSQKQNRLSTLNFIYCTYLAIVIMKLGRRWFISTYFEEECKWVWRTLMPKIMYFPEPSGEVRGPVRKKELDRWWNNYSYGVMWTNHPSLIILFCYPQAFVMSPFCSYSIMQIWKTKFSWYLIMIYLHHIRYIFLRVYEYSIIINAYQNINKTKLDTNRWRIRK